MITGAFKSKTIWGNIILILLIVASKYVEVPESERSLILGFFESPQTQLVIVTIYNIIIRFFTNKPLELK